MSRKDEKRRGFFHDLAEKGGEKSMAISIVTEKKRAKQRRNGEEEESERVALFPSGLAGNQGEQEDNSGERGDRTIANYDEQGKVAAFIEIAGRLAIGRRYPIVLRCK